jgi:hypothetical protein
MVEISQLCRSPSPNQQHRMAAASAVIAGRFVVSDATSEETVASATSPLRSASSCGKRRIAGRFIVADEDPTPVYHTSRFEILDLPVIPEGREEEPLGDMLRTLGDRVSVSDSARSSYICV